MPARLGFTLHLVAIVVLAVALCVGIFANSTRGRVDTLADVKGRLTGTRVCEVSGTIAAPPPAAAVPVRKTITDTADLARLVAAMPAFELIPTNSAWNLQGQATVLEFPAEGVTLQVTEWTIVCGVNGEYYYGGYKTAEMAAFHRLVVGLAK